MLRLSTGSCAFRPMRPVPLAGFARRTVPYEEVRDDLEAVFLRFSDENGGAVVLGSIDTLYLTDRSLSDIEQAVGGECAPLCLFATHTHTAPSLTPDLPLPVLGVHDWEWYRSVVLRCARTIDRLAEASGEEVTLRYGERAADLNVNRRRPRPGPGAADRSIQRPPVGDAMGDRYRIQGGGCGTPWVTAATLCGTRGQGIALTGFAIRLAAEPSERFDVVYQGAFVESGVTGPRRNGEPCVPSRIDDALEAMHIRLIERAGA